MWYAIYVVLQLRQRAMVELATQRTIIRQHDVRRHLIDLPPNSTSFTACFMCCSISAICWFISFHLIKFTQLKNACFSFLLQFHVWWGAGMVCLERGKWFAYGPARWLSSVMVRMLGLCFSAWAQFPVMELSDSSLEQAANTHVLPSPSCISW